MFSILLNRLFPILSLLFFSRCDSPDLPPDTKDSLAVDPEDTLQAPLIPEPSEGDAGSLSILMLEFTDPRQQNAFRFQKITGKKVYCSPAADSSDRSGYSYVRVAADEWGKIFGLEVRDHTVAGAGNSMDTDLAYYTILDKTKLVRPLKLLLAGFYLQNDPKFAVYDEAAPEKCPDYFN